MTIKPVYTVAELGRMMGMTRNRAMRLLCRANVPIQPGDPRVVYLSDIKAMAPDIWSSMEEAAHLNGLARTG